jgi:hypothetical protein
MGRRRRRRRRCEAYKYIAWRNVKLLDVTSGGRKLTLSFKREKKKV